MNFAKEIKKARTKLDLSQAEFGKIFGVKAPAVSLWEKGDRQAPYKVISYILDVNENIVICPNCEGKGYVRKK